MGLSTARARRDEPIIRVPALGLSVRVRVSPDGERSSPTIVDTTNAPGLGPPLHHRPEAEIFEIVTGRYLFEVNGRRFIARRGDLVSVPAGATRAFVNVTGTGARQKIIIQPGIDAAAYFSEFAHALDPLAHRSDSSQAERLRRFGERWGVVFLGAPLAADDAVLFGGAF